MGSVLSPVTNSVHGLTSLGFKHSGELDRTTNKSIELAAAIDYVAPVICFVIPEGTENVEDDHGELVQVVVRQR